MSNKSPLFLVITEQDPHQEDVIIDTYSRILDAFYYLHEKITGNSTITEEGMLDVMLEALGDSLQHNTKYFYNKQLPEVKNFPLNHDELMVILDLSPEVDLKPYQDWVDLMFKSKSQPITIKLMRLSMKENNQWFLTLVNEWSEEPCPF